MQVNDEKYEVTFKGIIYADESNYNDKSDKLRIVKSVNISSIIIMCAVLTSMYINEVTNLLVFIMCAMSVTWVVTFIRQCKYEMEQIENRDGEF